MRKIPELLSIFLSFFKLGFFTFGGGYVMIPLIHQEFISQGLVVSDETFASIIAIAGMCPGPVATNAAIGFGYTLAGIPGLLAAFLGVTSPCLIIVFAVSSFFFKIYENSYVQSSLKTLRPVITAVITYAAFNMAFGIIKLNPTDYVFIVKNIFIFSICFLLLLKTKVHPLFLIIGSGGLGYLLFYLL